MMPSPRHPLAPPGTPPAAAPVSVPASPERIHTEAELENVLTQPGPQLVDFIPTVRSPLMVLGAGGKMGPTLAVLAHRAAQQAGHKLEVIAASRFSDPQAQVWLESRGVKTLSVDLLERKSVERLPDAENIIYLVGLKFGTTQNPSGTWAANTLAPAHVAERYATSRIVALSTGNVYPLVPVTSGGATEREPLTPLGEYANAAVARERIFEYFAGRHGTRLALLRLNYAVELRYGVLVDIAQKVLAGESIDLTSGYFNCLWQGDANDLILRSLALASHPPRAFNLTSPVTYRVRDVAVRFSELLRRPARCVGQEADTALLSNASPLCAELGSPTTPFETVLRWIAQWVQSGGRSLNRPTHFEVRNGVY